MAERKSNERLAEAMRAAGLSNKALARRVRELSERRGAPHGCDHTAVSRWLAGTNPREHTARLIADVLSDRLGRNVSLADAGLAASASIDPRESVTYGGAPDGAIDVVARLWSADLHEARTILTATVDVGVWSDAALSWLVHSSDRGDDAHVRRVGRTDVDAVRLTVEMFAGLDNQFGGGHARRALIQFLRSDLAPMLDARHSGTIGGDLYEAAAQAALLAAWMSYDAGIHGLAQRYFVQALRLADAANARLLGANILDAMSHQATFLGRSHEAANLASAARSGARGLATPTLESHFYAMEARALAAGGDVAGCLRSLSESVRVFERRSPGHDPEWFNYFDDAELSAEFGHCFRDIGKSRDAVTYAQRALSGLSPRSDFFVTMVRAEALLGGEGSAADVDAACQAALSALELGGGLKSARCAAYLRAFRKKLKQYSSTPAVRHFSECASQHSLWASGDPAI